MDPQEKKFDNGALSSSLATIGEQTGKIADGDAHDKDALAKAVETAAEQAALLKAGGHTDGDEIKAMLAQMQADIDKSMALSIEASKLGLTLRGGAAIIPEGRDRRLQMLADGRAFLTDDAAKRFGAYFVCLAQSMNPHLARFEIPALTKDIAEDVMKAGDIDPTAAGSGLELVPNESRAELIRNVEATSNFAPQMRRVPLTTMGTTTWPKRTGGLTAYPTAVAAVIERSGPTLATVQMQPVKWAALTGIPNEMFLYPSMLVEVGQFVGIEMVYAMAYAADNAVINGDGTATYGGITGIMQSATISAIAAAATHTTFATLTGTDVGNVVGGLTKDYAIRAARWGVSLSVRGKLRNIRTTDGLPLFERGTGGEPSTIDGYPYTLGNVMPAAGSVSAGGKYGFFGDLRLSHYFGMVKNVAIDTSPHVWFTSDMTAVRGIVHMDSTEVDTDAIKTAKLADE